jgi:cellulose synthase-like protein
LYGARPILVGPPLAATSIPSDDDFEDAPEFTPSSATMSGDYPNYTVLMPPTPDNQPSGGAQSSAPGGGGTKPGDLPLPSYGSNKVVNRRGGTDDGAKMDRRLSTARVSAPSKSLLVRSQTGDFDNNRWLFETKGTYGIGNAYWPQDGRAYAANDDDDVGGCAGRVKMEDLVDKPWKPLSRKVPIPPGILSPYRLVVGSRCPC